MVVCRRDSDDIDNLNPLDGLSDKRLSGLADTAVLTGSPISQSSILSGGSAQGTGSMAAAVDSFLMGKCIVLYMASVIFIESCGLTEHFIFLPRIYQMLCFLI